MTGNPLFCRTFHAINERKAEALERDDLPRHNDADKEHRTMPFEHDMGETRPEINREHTQNTQDNWQSLGSVAAREVAV